jgi:DNA end-binding protein Ku
MAEALIDSLSSDFDPSQYRDEYREDLLAMIERKAEGKDVVKTASEEPEPTKAPDLMAALEESIAAVRGRDSGGKKPSRPKAAPKAKSKAKSSTSNGSGSAKGKSPAKPKSKPKSKSRS